MKAILAISLVLFATGCTRSSSGPTVDPAPPASQKQYSLEGKVSLLLKTFIGSARAAEVAAAAKLSDLSAGDLCSANSDDRCAVLVQMTSDGVASAQEKDALAVGVTKVDADSSKFKFELKGPLSEKEIYKILILKSHFAFDVQGKALSIREMTLLGSDANVASDSDSSTELQVNPSESYISKAKLDSLLAHLSDSKENIKALLLNINNKGQRIVQAIQQFSGASADGDVATAFLDSISDSPLKSLMDAKIEAEINRPVEQEDGESLVSSLKIARDSGNGIKDGSITKKELDEKDGFIVSESLRFHISSLSQSEKEIQVDELVRLSVSARKDWGRAQVNNNTKANELQAKVVALAPKTKCIEPDTAALCKSQQDALVSCQADSSAPMGFIGAPGAAFVPMGPPACMIQLMNLTSCKGVNSAATCSKESQSSEYLQAQADLSAVQNSRESQDGDFASKMQQIMSSIKTIMTSLAGSEYTIPALDQHPEYMSDAPAATSPIYDRSAINID